MKVHHHIFSFIFKYLFKRLSFFNNSNNLRIITLHHIKSDDINNFQTKLIHIKKNYNVISPNEFLFTITNNLKFKNKSILFTLDDGYYSQKEIGEFLHSINISAIFFIVPKFVKINNIAESKRFIKENINQNIALNNFDPRMRNMTISDIKKLIMLKHSIGMHTLNHTKLSSIIEQKQLETEIFSDHINFFKEIGINKSEYFAYPYGNIESINEKSLKVIRENFKYIFSGIRGDNFGHVNQNIFYRDAVEGNDTIDLINSFLRGFFDWRYLFSRNKIEKWKI